MGFKENLRKTETRERRRVASLWLRCLDEGRCVEIDGLGTLKPRPDGTFDFVADTKPRVFVAYVEEDLAGAQRLYESLESAGFRPWLDKHKLLPGQNWPRAIERAISNSDFFVPCFSRRSVFKRGTFHSELRYALDCASNRPLDETYIIPVRLEVCEVPIRICREFQYVDLFPNWEMGCASITKAVKRQVMTRARKTATAC